MNQKEKFIINISIILLSYSYAITNYKFASFFFASLGVVLSIWFHSLASLLGHRTKIIVCALLASITIQLSGLVKVLPTLPYITVCNIIISAIWMDSSNKALEGPLRIYFGVFMSHLCIASVLPIEMIPYFASQLPSSIVSLYFFLFLLYFPLLFFYLVKQIHYLKLQKIMYNNLTIHKQGK